MRLGLRMRAQGHSAWRRLSREQQFTPLRDLCRQMVCQRCGGRAPAVVISGRYGTGGSIQEFWRWPKR